jgi:hypothetical protein
MIVPKREPQSERGCGPLSLTECFVSFSPYGAIGTQISSFLLEGKISQPPNGYILFSREWRRKLATIYLKEKSSEISVR